MSRKHFIAVAESIKTQIEATRFSTTLTLAAQVASADTARRFARDLARIAASDNPRFDTCRFLRACGVNS